MQRRLVVHDLLFDESDLFDPRGRYPRIVGHPVVSVNSSDSKASMNLGVDEAEASWGTVLKALYLDEWNIKSSSRCLLRECRPLLLPDADLVNLRCPFHQNHV